MKKLLIFCAFCCTSLMMSAQTNSWAQQLVNNITADINLPQKATEELTLYILQQEEIINDLNYRIQKLEQEQ